VKNFPFHKDAAAVPLILAALIWLVFGLQQWFGLDGCYGIIPLQVDGLKGILLSPLFHADFKHIASNTVPLVVLTFLTFYFYEKLAYFVIVFGWIVSGFMVWIFPAFDFMNSTIVSCHVGASGIIYLLAFFLFFSGVFRKDTALMAVSLVVVFLYGSMVWGMFPQEIFGKYSDHTISWQSHLAGGICGVLLAFVLRGHGRQKLLDFWQQPNYNSVQEEELWQRYKAQFPEYFLEEENSSDEPECPFNLFYRYRKE
jgi:membrane associated rhomboid family serine protease